MNYLRVSFIFYLAELVGTVAVCVKVSRRPGGFVKAQTALAKAVAAERRRQARA